MELVGTWEAKWKERSETTTYEVGNLVCFVCGSSLPLLRVSPMLVFFISLKNH